MQRNPSTSDRRTGLKNIISTYPPQSPRTGYTGAKPDSMRQNLCLTNQSPVLIKWPVNTQSASDEVCFRHRSPIAAVIAVVAIIAQGKIAVPRHGECAIWLRQIFVAQSVSSIRRFRRHDPGETIALCFFAIDVEKRRIDSQLIAGQTGQPLDIKWRACLRVFANPWNMICPKDKNIPVMRLNKVVAALIDKHLVARVDCASGNDLPAVTDATRKNVEIMTERLGGRVHEKVLSLADQPRKSKKEQGFFWHNLKDLILFTGDHVDVIATQNNELAD